MEISNYRTADLHIHSYYSDGTMSPQQILEDAVEKKLRMISITDHDVLEGSLELLQCSKSYDIECIAGVELNTFENGVNFHVLAYDFDTTDMEFARFVRENRERLDKISDRLIQMMQKDYPNLPAFSSFTYDRSLGGWKALHYLMNEGICRDASEAFSMYDRYHCSYESAGFYDVATISDILHKAGGKAVLAHPGRVILHSSLGEFKDKLEKMSECGLDGIECYYPSHSKEITDICIELCNQKNMIITCGSDCHGKFGKVDIGACTV